MFGTYACGTAAIPPLAPPGSTPADPIQLPGAAGAGPDPDPVTDQLPAQLRDLINTYAYANGNPVAPPCEEQAPLGNLSGQSGQVPARAGGPGEVTDLPGRARRGTKLIVLC